MGHNKTPDQPGGHTPARCPYIFVFSIRILKLHVKRLRKILAEEMRGARLEGFSILHQSLYTVSFHGSCKSFRGSLNSCNYRHCHKLLRKSFVHIQHFKSLFDRFLLRGMGRMPFLPEKLHGTQKEPGPHRPTNHICPLVNQYWQVPVRLDPIPVSIPYNGFRGRPDDQLFFQLGAGIDNHPALNTFQAAVRDNSTLLGETFYMLRLKGATCFRYKESEIVIFVDCLFNHHLQISLAHFLLVISYLSTVYIFPYAS